MQGWQFDHLTRTLGKATSRRQVIKGLLGGLGAALLGRSLPDNGLLPRVALAAPAEVCDRQRCKAQVDQAMAQCFRACSILYPPTKGGGWNGRICKLSCYGNGLHQKYECEHNESGCFLDGTCCNQQCVDVKTDSNNCGACGTVCPDGGSCSDGQCQCTEDQTRCDGQCVDTQTDQNNCGTCGHACASCEACVAGQCAPIECLDGQTCCQGNCVALCVNGDAPDPTTCECNNCKGQIDGAACDANDASKVCCQEQCVSNQCQSGKTFDLDTCSCQCSSSCPTGQLQDPDTCQCQDLCAGKTCGECQTCDPTSGDCVQADDQTPCGTNQVCCSGVCKDSCGDNQCPSGQYACAVTPSYNPEVVRPDYFCCDNGSPCCGGNGYLYDACQGSTFNGQHVCCAPGTNQCGSDCCDHNTQACLTFAANSANPVSYCCPAGSGDVLPDGTCCKAGETTYPCTAGGYACCATPWCCS